jgi:hypothetical protein
MRANLLPGLVVLCVLLSWSPTPAFGQESPTVEEGEVAQVAVAFLAALSVADTTALARLLAPQAMIHSVRGGEGEATLRAVNREAFLTSLGGEEQVLLERMWDPKVMVQDRVAMVWTPYDFYLNGAFSHCGIDVFTLLKGEEGWQVTGITYNVLQEGCPPSPLGPPGKGRFQR